MKKVLIVISMAIILMGALWIKSISVVSDETQYTLLFSNIGGLQQGDIVSVNGVVQGTVDRIYLQESQVAVQIGINKDVQFTDSSTVAVANVGLFGERKVEISLSSKGDLYAPDTDSVVNFIRGEYQTGLSEAIGMAGNLLQQADTVLTSIDRIVDTLHSGNLGNDSINKVEISITINDVTYRAEATNENLGDALDTVKQQLAQQVDVQN